MRQISVLILLFIFNSCSEFYLGEEVKNTPRENFNSLWNTLDQKYSFFAYKNINWDEVYLKYSSKVKDNTTDIELFNIFFQMLGELRDAHVNLVSPFNVSRYEDVFTKGAENYDNRLVQTYYLKSDYFITGPFKHQVISNGRIGYVRFASFSTEVTESEIYFIINKYKNLDGIIFDVRSNGGGYVSNVFTICRAFADERRHVYTSFIKTGPGHEEFSEPNKVYLDPSLKEPFTKPVCILTNRGCYSATSFFVLAMKAFPNVTTVGDTTGGGLGAPTGGELPNGWSFRFSCTKTLSPSGINFEDGMPPDRVKILRASDISKGIDTIIEEAVKFILSK